MNDDIENTNNPRLKELLIAAQTQYGFKFGGGKSIAANSSDKVTIHITSDSGFECESVTGFYTTLTAEDTDGGACQLSAQLFDDGRDLQMTNTHIPLSIFLSPGRQRSSGVAGDASNQLFFPIPFPYMFKPNSDIRIEIDNEAAYANYVYFLFHGIKHVVTI